MKSAQQTAAQSLWQWQTKTMLRSFLSRLVAKVWHPRETVKGQPSRFIEIARLLDARDFASAERQLLDLPMTDLTSAEHRLGLTFWRRIWSQRFVGMTERLDAVGSWYFALEAARASGNIWPAYQMAETAEAHIGAAEVAQSLAMALWDHLPTADFGLQYQAVSLCFAGGNPQHLEAVFVHLLGKDADFVPDYWQYQGLARRWSELGGDLIENRGPALLQQVGRTDLERLFRVYLIILRQSDMPQALALARELTGERERERMAAYLLGASQTNDLMQTAVDVHDALAASSAVEDRQFMHARLCVARGDWPKVLELTQPLLDHRDHRNAAVCLRALALAHGGDYDNAGAALDHVRFSTMAPWFLRGRAALIGMTRRILEDGGTPVDKLASPELAPGKGRPLAQSLWVGPRLRWIEQLSMKTYLLNGWRYRLYVYDEPEGVPEGVEICDATAVMPRSAIFREGDGSGAHKGSLGAFSDLFRYALLTRIGGLWTDTDVVNLRAFEPAGQRLVCSEWTDAGLIGPNGAMMAAPANDPMQRQALAAAEEVLATEAMHFARIGPELLAELLGQGGQQGYQVLPPHFLNPIGWMETGRLLQPFGATRQLPVLQNAHNLHVYTETWRLIGLGLSEPPKGDGFLPKLYDRVMNASGKAPRRVMELIAA